MVNEDVRILTRELIIMKDELGQLRWSDMLIMWTKTDYV